MKESNTKLESLERVKRELVINQLEKEFFTSFSETSINRLHILFNEIKKNPNIIKEMTSSVVATKIFKRALVLYGEN